MNFLKIILTLLISLLIIIGGVWAGDFTDEEIVNAIYKAENSKKFPYGIKSIDTKGDETYARKICFNTVRNNRKRYKDYGHKEYDTYLEFLQSRYCPTKGNLSKAEKRLNGFWLKNVLYFLNK